MKRDFSYDVYGPFNLVSAIKLWWYVYCHRNGWLIKQTWCHVPMLVFIIFALGPYGMLLHHQYKEVNPVFKTNDVHVNQTSNTTQDYYCSVSNLSFDLFLSSQQKHVESQQNNIRAT